MPVTIALTTEQKVTATLNPTTGAGNPATLDGTPTWTSSDESVATCVPSADGLSCEIVSGSAPGTCTVTVTADADLDATEVREISDTIAVNIVAAEAAGLGLGLGEPTNK